MKDCIFCQIIGAEKPAKLIWEGEHAVAIAPLELVGPGHTLVLIKRHYKDIFDVPGDEFAAFCRDVQDSARFVKEKFSAEGMNILQASGREAQQSVFHLHFHLVPRFSGDGLDLWIKNRL